MRRGRESGRADRKSRASWPSRATWILLLSFSLRRAWRQSSTSSALSSTRRISTSLCCGILNLAWYLLILEQNRSLGGFSECEIKSGPLLDRRFGPHRAAVFVDDTGNRRQSDAGAVKILKSVQALEDSE